MKNDSKPKFATTLTLSSKLLPEEMTPSSITPLKIMPYNKGIADKICHAHASGEPLGVIARRRGMPCRADMYKWLETVPEFRGALQRASVLFCHSMLDDVVALADGDDDARERQMQINARLSVAGKYQDYLYGDEGAVQDLTDEQIDKIITEFFGRFTANRTVPSVDGNGRKNTPKTGA